MVINESIFTTSPETSLFRVRDQRTYYWHKRNPANWPSPPREAGPILIFPWLLTCCVAFVSSSNDNIYFTGMLWSSTNAKNCSSWWLKDQDRIYHNARELKALYRSLICPLSGWGRLVAGVPCAHVVPLQVCLSPSHFNSSCSLPLCKLTGDCLSEWRLKTDRLSRLCDISLFSLCVWSHLWSGVEMLSSDPGSFPYLLFGFSPLFQYFILWPLGSIWQE